MFTKTHPYLDKLKELSKPFEDLESLYRAMSDDRFHHYDSIYDLILESDDSQAPRTLLWAISPIAGLGETISKHYATRVDQYSNFDTYLDYYNPKLNHHPSPESDWLENSIRFFISSWKISIKPVLIDLDSSISFTQDIKILLLGREKYWPLKHAKSYKEIDSQAKKVYPKLRRKSTSIARDAERQINQTLRDYMKSELPKVEKINEVLKALVQVERDFMNKYNELSDRYQEIHNDNLKAALEEQRIHYDQRLSEAETNHQKQLIEMHETIKNLQEMVDKSYQQNELLLEVQKQQSGNYENQLLGLLEKLKDES